MNKRLCPLGLCLAACLIITPACTVSEDAEPTGSAGAPGAAGMTGAAGGPGTAGALGTAGAAGAGAAGAGAAGASGAAGAVGAAGNAGTAGATGAAGVTGSAGRTGGNDAGAGSTGSAGSNGTAGAKGPDAGTDGGGAPTFTMIYNLIMGPTPMVAASGCGGGTCHRDPGGGKGIQHIDMTTKAAAYAGSKKFVVLGNLNGSKLYTTVNTGVMPEGKPKLPANLITMIADWIRAGALDN